VKGSGGGGIDAVYEVAHNQEARSPSFWSPMQERGRCVTQSPSRSYTPNPRLESPAVQSLHTTVLPLGNTPLFPLEVQIRTSKMQELAEFGIAGTSCPATATP